MAPSDSHGKRGRRSRRDRAHQQSHLDTREAAPIPSHPDIPSTPGELITDQDGLAMVIDHVQSQDLHAFDTEFIGEETYYPKLCLVQIGTRERVFLIDPLAIENLEPIFAAIAAPDQTTLVHAGRQDLQILTRALGRPPKNVVDTQILAGFANLPWPCSLSGSVESIVDAPMPGGMTFTAWDARPLSARQQRYAADDVRYLPLLHERLAARVKENGHTAWANAACACFESAQWYEMDLQSQQRKIEGSRRLRPAERRILNALVHMRDQIARDENLPPRATMPDAAVRTIARKRPTSSDAIAQIKGMPRGIATRHGQRLMHAIEQAANDEGVQMPSLKRDESPDDRVAIDGLWHAFATASIGCGVAPGLAISRAELACWYLNDRDEMPGRTPWQQQIVSTLLTPLLNEGRVLSVAWQNEGLRQVIDP